MDLPLPRAFFVSCVVLSVAVGAAVHISLCSCDGSGVLNHRGHWVEKVESWRGRESHCHGESRGWLSRLGGNYPSDTRERARNYIHMAMHVWIIIEQRKGLVMSVSCGFVSPHRWTQMYYGFVHCIISHKSSRWWFRQKNIGVDDIAYETNSIPSTTYYSANNVRISILLLFRYSF